MSDPPSAEEERAARARARQAARALKEGGGETSKRLRGGGERFREAAGSIASGAGRDFGERGRAAASRAGTLLREGGTRLGAAARAGSAGAARLAKVLTPARALTVAAIGCAVLLSLSQFADFRGIAVGGDQFTGDLGTVAPPPEVDRREAGDPHSYAFVPLGLIAAGLLGLAARSGRWQLTRLAAAIGLAAVIVALAVDRPAGLDEGAVARDFAGAEAKLLGGFWAQLFAGVGLAATAMLLGETLRDRAGRVRRPARAEPSPEAAAS